MNNNVKCLMCIMALPYKGLFKDKCPFHGGFLFVSYLNLHPWLPDPNNHIKANESSQEIVRFMTRVMCSFNTSVLPVCTDQINVSIAC